MDAIAIRYSDWEPACDKSNLYSPPHIADDRVDSLLRSAIASQMLLRPGIELKWVSPRWAAIAVKGRAAVAVVTPHAPASESLEKRFFQQADKWQRETGHLSSPTQRMMHPSYQAILGMGIDNEHEIVVLLIRDMQQRGRPWFGALSYITKENPINRADAGEMDKMINSWVKWGKSRGLL
ncbi:MAG: hypothetical protein EXQ52_06050 [Bryobacterales bacterium]|nr:hypothetical protein [Bryobacterales bacterium]